MSALPKSQPELLIGMIRDPLQWDRWPEARAMLDPALQRSDDAWPEIEAALSFDDMQLWAVLDGQSLLAAAVTRIALTKGKEVIELFLLGGEQHQRWLAALDDTICQNAPPSCVAIRAFGREGWKKPLGVQGWRVSAVAYEKALA